MFKRSLYAGLIALLLAASLGAPTSPAVAAGCTSPYVVQKGDSLARIARLCGATIAALKAANGLTQDIIHPNQLITLPAGVATGVTAQTQVPAATGHCASPYIVQRGDSLARIARLCGTSVAALKAVNGLTQDIIFPNQPIVLPGGQPAAGAQPKVIIAVVDGWRYEDTYGDASHANIPHVWDDLRPLGTLYTEFYNLGETNTAAGHAAILGGVWQPIPNDGTGRPTAPTLFEYFRAAGASAQDTALVFDGDPSGKAGRWAYSSAPGYGAQYAATIYHANGSGTDDSLVLTTALGALAQHPRLTLIAFPAVDEWAHTGDFAAYTSAIQSVDGVLWQLWQAIQADPFYAGQTTLLITNDHGRRLDDFTTHGGNTPSEQHVTLLALGPRTPAGLVVSDPHTLRDIAPTVGVLLNFPTPLAQGGVLWDMVK